MKTSSFNTYALVFALTSLIVWGVTIPTAKAQTFIGRPALNAQPKVLEASVYPIINSSQIKVLYEHHGSAPVRIQIQDERGTIWHDQYEYKTQYRGRFDLAGLPAGAYQVSLQTKDSQYTQVIHISPPVTTRIALVPPVKKPATAPEQVVVNP